MTRRRHFIYYCTALLGASLSAPRKARAISSSETSAVAGRLLQVGRTRAIKTIGDAAKIASAGTSVEVDAGDYVGDVAVWDRDGLTIRAVGGRVRLFAAGAAAEGKGIWVVRARNIQVAGFDFEGAAVASRNGAGLRFERGSLRVQDCRFLRNEMGLLTNNEPDAELEVADCEFAYNQRPDGHNHNLYAGSISRLSVIGSYFHHARIGHLLKSRARINHIFYNRLTDEQGGTASYELEFPNGGIAYVAGNLIEQVAQTDNPHLIRFGAEGYKWPHNEIYLVNNTLVDGLPRNGIFLGVAPGAQIVRGVNNLLVGRANLGAAAAGDFDNNFNVDRDVFEQRTADDYRLKRASGLLGLAVEPKDANGVDLRIHAEYAHPRGTRTIASQPFNPGAVQQLEAGSTH